MTNNYNLRRDELNEEDKHQLGNSTAHLVVILATKDLEFAVSRTTLRAYADELRGLANVIEFSAQNREERLPVSVLRIKRMITELNKRNRKRFKKDMAPSR